MICNIIQSPWALPEIIYCPKRLDKIKSIVIKNFHILHSNDFEVKSKNSMTFIATYPIIKIRWTLDCSRPHTPQSMGITTRGNEGRIIAYLYTRPMRKGFMTKMIKLFQSVSKENTVYYSFIGDSQIIFKFWIVFPFCLEIKLPSLRFYDCPC